MADLLPPYTFKHDGVTVTYTRATVGTMLEKRRLQLALIEAHGYDSSAAMPADLWDNISEYAAAMSQSRADAPWWTSSNAPLENIRAAFELFLEQDTALFGEFVTANGATLPSKKTMTSISETSSS
jgi:hypothetical protein